MFIVTLYYLSIKYLFLDLLIKMPVLSSYLIVDKCNPLVLMFQQMTYLNIIQYKGILLISFLYRLFNFFSFKYQLQHSSQFYDVTAIYRYFSTNKSFIDSSRIYRSYSLSLMKYSEIFRVFKTRTYSIINSLK